MSIEGLYVTKQLMVVSDVNKDLRGKMEYKLYCIIVLYGLIDNR